MPTVWAWIGSFTLHVWVSRSFEDDLKWLMWSAQHRTDLGTQGIPWMVDISTLRLELLNRSITDTLNGRSVQRGSLFCAYRIFNSIPGLIPTRCQEQPSPPLALMTKTVSRYFQHLLGDTETKSLLVGSHCFGSIQVLEDEDNLILLLNMHIFKLQL